MVAAGVSFWLSIGNDTSHLEDVQHFNKRFPIELVSLMTLLKITKNAPLEKVQLTRFLQACEHAARLGGAVLMELLGQANVWEKGPGDYVTQADFQSQNAIRNYLLTEFPEHQFIGEEVPIELDANSNSATSQPLRPLSPFCWIVDPLDGTTNFVHQLRSFSVSVALRYNDQIVVGTVFDPTTNECFSAINGAGASLNGVSIKPSQCCGLEQALVVFSMKSHVKTGDPQLQRVLNVISHASSFRRLGSAALNLCFVACGRVDAYWATNLQIWDVAAGWLIAVESGAVLADFDDLPLQLGRPRFCVTSTQALFDQLKTHLQVPEDK